MAEAADGHGVRFLEIDSPGLVSKLPHSALVASNTSAIYWIADTILYTVDLHRGIDILRWTGE